jgi:hypothetical protein
MIGFIGLLDPARDYTLWFTDTHTLTPVSRVTSLLPLLGSGFNADVPLPLCSRTVPGLSYQLLTATARSG